MVSPEQNPRRHLYRTSSGLLDANPAGQFLVHTFHSDIARGERDIGVIIADERDAQPYRSIKVIGLGRDQGPREEFVLSHPGQRRRLDHIYEHSAAVGGVLLRNPVETELDRVYTFPPAEGGLPEQRSLYAAEFLIVAAWRMGIPLNV